MDTGDDDLYLEQFAAAGARTEADAGLADLADLVKWCAGAGARMTIAPPLSNPDRQWTIRVEVVHGFTVHRPTFEEAVTAACDHATRVPLARRRDVRYPAL